MVNTIKSLAIDSTAIVWTYAFASNIEDLTLSFELASFILGFIFLSTRFVVFCIRNIEDIKKFIRLLRKKNK